MKQLLWLSGSAAGGLETVVPLADPSYFAPDEEGDYPEYFRVPRGCKAKLWAVQLGGHPFSAQIEVSQDTTIANGDSFVPSGPELVHAIETYTDYGEGTPIEAIRSGFSNYRFGTRPLVIVESRNGTEAFRVKYESLTAEELDKSSIGLLVEITDED